MGKVKDVLIFFVLLAVIEWLAVSACVLLDRVGKARKPSISALNQSDKWGFPSESFQIGPYLTIPLLIVGIPLAFVFILLMSPIWLPLFLWEYLPEKTREAVLCKLGKLPSETATPPQPPRESQAS